MRAAAIARGASVLGVVLPNGLVLLFSRPLWWLAFLFSRRMWLR
jgi:hypothetical protein